MNTQTKHTPGPWGIGEDSDVFAGSACVAQVCGAPDGIRESIGNARLIAAAPELLEACKNAADWLGRSIRIDDREQAQDIRAAIAKAEGN